MSAPELNGVPAEVLAERVRAHDKHGDDSIEAIVASDPRWLSILVEEGGEAIEEAIRNYMFAAILGKRLGRVAHLHTVTAADTDDKSWPVLRKELVQTMGVCWAWIDAGDAAAQEQPHPFAGYAEDPNTCQVCGNDPGDGIHSDFPQPLAVETEHEDG